MYRRLRISFFYLFTFLLFTACGGKYKYEEVKGDLSKTRIYTLDNGLKVYLSVNKEKPRIQTYIAVRTGSKNDPAETTGLAHYLEHLKTHDVVLWEKHGTVAVGQDIMDAFDQTDVLCKAANIYMCARSMGSEPDGMTEEAMKEVQEVFKLPKKRPC